MEGGTVCYQWNLQWVDCTVLLPLQPWVDLQDALSKVPVFHTTLFLMKEPTSPRPPTFLLLLLLLLNESYGF